MEHTSTINQQMFTKLKGILNEKGYQCQCGWAKIIKDIGNSFSTDVITQQSPSRKRDNDRYRLQTTGLVGVNDEMLRNRKEFIEHFVKEKEQ